MQQRSIMSSTQVFELKSSWEVFKRENPGTRIRDAADTLAVSELELLATGCGDNVIRLDPDWSAILKDLHKLGPVMALTRSEYAVHERVGEYNNIKIMGSMGLALNEDIDLRLFLSHWHQGLAVYEKTPRGERHSLQFFDADGTAVHKIYLNADSNEKAYRELVEKYQSNDQSPAIEITSASPETTYTADSEVDVEGFRDEWRALKDTHDFHGLLRKFSLSRTQALRLAGSEFARQIAPGLFSEFMQSLSVEKLNVMVFVGSPGVIQIHTGAVRNLKIMGPWFNVLDKTFNLHLRQDAIDSAWVVRKPTVDGDVNSLELYDAAGNVIAYLFGARKPGQAENIDWRKKINALPTLG